MVNIIRRFRQPLLMAITLFTIVSFIWLYNRNSMSDKYRMGSVQMFGKNISVNAYRRSERLFKLSAILQLNDLVEDLIGRDTFFQIMTRQISEDQAAQEFANSELVLRHEADALGIEPTAEEVFEAVQKVPGFQSNGQFDPTRYNMFIATQLGSEGLSADAIEDAVRDNLRLIKIKALLRGAVMPTPGEIRSAYEESYRKTDASVVRLKLDDFKAAVQITDEDLKKLFEERKSTLNTAEKRKVKFVAFVLDPKKPLTGTDRRDALEKLSEQASDFSAKMTEKDANFDAVAGKATVPVQESKEFEESAPPEGLDANAAAAAFTLTKAQPNSDAMVSQKRDGYFVLQLSDIIPSRPLTFDEAKAQLTDQLRQERAQEAMNLKATEIHAKIETELKAGKSFADAAQAAGVKAEAFPTFSMAERKGEGPDANEIIGTATELHEGDLSKFTPTGTGGVIVHLDKRLPIDEADFDKQKPEMQKGLEEGQSSALLGAWLKQRVKEANVHFLTGG